MSDTDTRLKVLLTTHAAVKAKIGDRMHLDKVPPAQGRPYVWFQRRSTGPSDTLDASIGEESFDFSYDLQAVAPIISEAKQIASLIRTVLNNYHGAFGDSTCQAIFVEDTDTGEEPLGIGENFGMSVVALDVRVML